MNADELTSWGYATLSVATPLSSDHVELPPKEHICDPDRSKHVLCGQLIRGWTVEILQAVAFDLGMENPRRCRSCVTALRKRLRIASAQ